MIVPGPLQAFDMHIKWVSLLCVKGWPLIISIIKLLSRYKLTVIGIWEEEIREVNISNLYLWFCAWLYTESAFPFCVYTKRLSVGKKLSYLNGHGVLRSSLWLIGTRKHKSLSLRNLKQMETGCHLSPGNKLVLSSKRLCFLLVLTRDSCQLPK
jgi:hypothetical protein